MKGCDSSLEQTVLSSCISLNAVVLSKSTSPQVLMTRCIKPQYDMYVCYVCALSMYVCVLVYVECVLCVHIQQWGIECLNSVTRCDVETLCTECNICILQSPLIEQSANRVLYTCSFKGPAQIQKRRNIMYACVWHTCGGCIQCVYVSCTVVCCVCVLVHIPVKFYGQTLGVG